MIRTTGCDSLGGRDAVLVGLVARHADVAQLRQ